MNRKTRFDKSEIPCRFKFCKNPSCKFWHPPVCLNYMSEKGCVHGDKCHFRHVEAEGKPNKKSKKGGAKGSVAILKESYTIGLCIPRFLSEKIYSTWTWKIGNKTRRQILQRHLAPNQTKFGKERVHRKVLSKSVRLVRSPCAPKRLWSKNDAPAKQRGIWRDFFTSSRIRTKTPFYIPGEVKGMPAPTTTSKRPEEREFASRFRSIDAHDEQKRIKLRRDGHS